ncbi:MULTISPECIES: methyltransferase domain-containing protein [Streptomyces]|uniref:methyltransferase domain-containing protein n=1 Tax=Streptomyces TaxID=1883 RepID=UPI000A668994|nr:MULTISPECIES: methyltransferase domain-containing protein [Streptomyces]
MRDSTVATAVELRAKCAAEIDSFGRLGYFNDRPWLRTAFETVPREHFTPDRVWVPQRGQDGLYPVLDRHEQPEQWLEAVYSPRLALITQIADGTVRIEDGPADSSDFTASISCPAVVVDMLHYLNPRPDERVLEIGTGTGYSSALLAHRIGAGNVTSVELQADLAASAHGRLHTLGYGGVQVHVADGEAGWEQGAPYDRLISTVGIHRVPPAWPRQVRPGGLIITPISTPLGSDALLWLQPDGDGSAHGGLITGVAFMKLKSQRQRAPWRELGWPRFPDWTVTVGRDGEQRIRTSS